MLDCSTPSLSSLFNTEELIASLLLATNEQKSSFTFNTDYKFDYERYFTIFSQLTGSGDPRYSLGSLLQDVYINFQNRANKYNAVLQNGGCQVIDGYVCDKNGNSIKVENSTCLPEDLIPITQTEVQNYVMSQYNFNINNHTKSFVKYIQDTFIKNKKTVELYDIPSASMFFIKISPDDIYIKYYFDVRNEVSKELGIITQSLFNFEGEDIYKALITPIPDYTKLV